MNKNNLLNQYQNDKTYGTGDHGIASPYQDICGRLRMMSLLIPGYSKDEDDGDADEDADTGNEDEE